MIFDEKEIDSSGQGSIDSPDEEAPNEESVSPWSRLMNYEGSADLGCLHLSNFTFKRILIRQKYRYRTFYVRTNLLCVTN
jgi:hypothetical protein